MVTSDKKRGVLGLTWDDSLGDERHHGGHGHTEDDVLAEAEEWQRLARLQTGHLELAQDPRVVVRLERLVVEVLHRLVVQQRVYALALGSSGRSRKAMPQFKCRLLFVNLIRKTFYNLGNLFIWWVLSTIPHFRSHFFLGLWVADDYSGCINLSNNQDFRTTNFFKKILTNQNLLSSIRFYHS